MIHEQIDDYRQPLHEQLMISYRGIHEKVDDAYRRTILRNDISICNTTRHKDHQVKYLLYITELWLHIYCFKRLRKNETILGQIIVELQAEWIATVYWRFNLTLSQTPPIPSEPFL